MLKTYLKIIYLIGIVILLNANFTNAYFMDSESISNNVFSAGCWAGPSIPLLSYPEDGYLAYPDTQWRLNPYMDWNDSFGCPGTTITYQYESYRDEALTILAYRSGWLSESRIPAPNTPLGQYYWRVRSFDGDKTSEWSNSRLLIVTNETPTPTPSISPTLFDFNDIATDNAE